MDAHTQLTVVCFVLYLLCLRDKDKSQVKGGQSSRSRRRPARLTARAYASNVPTLPWNLMSIGFGFLPMERMFWLAPTRPLLTFSG